MTRLALCLLLLATGASATENVIDVQHDSQLQAGNERQLSPHETQPEPTPALAPGRWTSEGYSM
ncbi:hypothetical protein RDI61_13930 [Pseudomonas plecoglossicida]|uniref:hypothetical protein n=1 Tax=Pseudomonas TaxID=286 RepID=UPI000761DEC3|nr:MULTISPECIES: hypothetical protein [Pseudomonas]MCE0851840.1 hypothetical protein [Pseudomonas asiatica]MDQ7965132.1 hypothetical protein [Pseudomonas plecoglossicida]WBM44637.1 hypothetical protein M2J85_18030 [Pseudomonas putida]WBM49042.1 hypothetical protein M2J85_12490 [Pseudomonas putida]WFG01061.1 hypothetical protein P3X84_18220 [Pseudomonas putida]